MPFCDGNCRLLVLFAGSYLSHPCRSRVSRRSMSRSDRSHALCSAGPRADVYLELLRCCSPHRDLATTHGTGPAVVPVRRVSIGDMPIGIPQAPCKHPIEPVLAQAMLIHWLEFGPCYLAQPAGWRNACKPGRRERKRLFLHRPGTCLSSRSISMQRSWHLRWWTGQSPSRPSHTTAVKTQGAAMSMPLARVAEHEGRLKGTNKRQRRIASRAPGAELICQPPSVRRS